MPSCWKAKSRCRAFLSWVWWMFFCGESFDLPPWKVKSCKHLHLKVSQIEKTWCFFFLTFGRICKNTACFFLFCSSFWKFLSPKLEAPSPEEVGMGGIPGFFWSWGAAILTMSNHGVRVCSTSCWRSLWLFYFLATWILFRTAEVGHFFPRKSACRKHLQSVATTLYTSSVYLNTWTWGLLCIVFLPKLLNPFLAPIFLQFAKSIGGTSAKPPSPGNFGCVAFWSFWTEVMAMFGACQPIWKSLKYLGNTNLSTAVSPWSPRDLFNFLDLDCFIL